jgi:hypothetical protein
MVNEAGSNVECDSFAAALALASLLDEPLAAKLPATQSNNPPQEDRIPITEPLINELTQCYFFALCQLNGIDCALSEATTRD